MQGDVKSIVKMVKNFYLKLILAVLFRIISKAVELIALVVVAEYVEKANLGLVYISLYLIFAIFISSYLDTFISHDISFKIVKNLQDKLYEHIDLIATDGVDEKNSADAAMIMLSDISVFEWFFGHCLVEWIGTLITLFVGLIYLARYSVVVMLIVAAGLALMMALPLIMPDKAKEKGLVMKEAFGQLNGIVADGVYGNKEISGFHWEKQFFDSLKEKNENYQRVFQKFSLEAEKQKTIEGIIVGAVLILSITLGISKLAIWVLVAQMLMCVKDTLAEGSNYGFVFGAATRIMNIFRKKPAVLDEGTGTIEGDNIKLSFENVAFSYVDNPILKNLSFEINEPGLIAIVSKSGGGKSTMSKLLQRIYDVKEGAIKINDQDIRNISLHDLRELITVIPQEAFLFTGSVEDNLKLVKPDATESEIANALQSACVEEDKNKSGGEKQRIAIAQGLLKNPKILVLDEATRALDQKYEKKIYDGIAKSRQGNITLVIAHRLSAIKACDKVLFIEDGRVNDFGNYDCLIKNNINFRNLVMGEGFE